MNRSRTLLALAIGGAISMALVSVASAQVVIAGPPVLLPATAPTIVLPSSYPVVTTYSIPTTAPRVAGYGTYRPIVAPPVYVAPVPTTVARPASIVAPNVLYRPAVVGTGIGGLPTVYVPGQPVRNALRYVLP